MAYGPAASGEESARVTPYDAADKKGHGNLFVGSIPPEFGEEDLKAKFSAFGTIISCKVLRDFHTNVSRGSGFVQLSSPEEAQAAIDAVSAEGTMQVKFADNVKGASKGKGKGKSETAPVPGQALPGDNLYLKFLPKILDQRALEDLFTAEGWTVAQSRMLLGGDQHQTNAAFVRLASAEEAAAAVEKMNDQILPGSETPIHVSIATPRPQAAPAVAAGGGWQAGGWQQPAANAWQAAAPSTDNLYVTNLPVEIDQATLSNIFVSAGYTVSTCRVLPQNTHIAVGATAAAMVRLASPEEAADAIQKLDGQKADGLLEPMRIKYANTPGQKGAGKEQVAMSTWQAASPTPWQGKAAGKGAVQSAPPVAKATGSMTLQVRYAGADAVPSDNLYIAGLPSPQIDQPTLRSLFTSLGVEPLRMKVMPDAQGRGSSAAMVQVASQEVAAQCIEALDSQSISCEEIREAGGIMDVDSGATTLVVKYAGPDETPSDNVFMSGLPSPQVDPAVLVKLCSALDLKVVRTKPMPDTRGIGHSQALVQFASQEQAATAIAMLNGEVFPDDLGEAGDAAGHGVPLTVRYQGSSGAEPSDNLFIGGLPSPQVDQASLTSVFSGLGFTVTRSRLLPDTQSRGMSAAMVQLASKEEAAAAIEALNGQMVDGLRAEAVAAGPVPLQARAAALWQSAPAAVSTFSPPPAQLSMKGKGKGKAPSFFAPPARIAAAPASAPGTISVKYAGAAQQPSENLYLSGLPGKSMEPATLKALFETLQLTIMRSKIIPDTKGLGSHAAMVQLRSQAEAASAIDLLNGQALSEEDLYSGGAAAPAPVAKVWKATTPAAAKPAAVAHEDEAMPQEADEENRPVEDNLSAALVAAPAASAQGGAAPSIKEWLQSLDDSGVMMQYSDGLTENFDSLKQLRECFVNGNELDDSFFVELSIKKIGHKKLFQKYFQENAL